MAMVKYPHEHMKLLSRVVWSEGMHLGPHHFQVQSRYFEDSIQFAISSLWFASYGLAGLELDADALYNGSVSLLHARGSGRSSHSGMLNGRPSGKMPRACSSETLPL